MGGLRLGTHGFTVGYCRPLLRSYNWILETSGKIHRDIFLQIFRPGRSSNFVVALRIWFQPREPFDEQKENARAEAEEHDGDAGGDAPESAGGRAAIVAAAHDDVAGHRDKQFKDAAAQEPAGAALEQGIRVVRFGEFMENRGPDEPENEDGDEHSHQGIQVGGSHFVGLERREDAENAKAFFLERGAENGQESGEKQVGQKKSGDEGGNP